MRKGFTLIEILVAMGIIIFLLVIVLPNIRLGEKQSALQRSASKLAQDLRRVEESTMSAKQYNCGNLKGYGIFFDASVDSSYRLGANCNDVFNPIEQIWLEKDVKIKEIKKDAQIIQSIYVYFYPPDPIVDLGTGVNEVKVTLSLESDSNAIKTIIINRAGLIYVE